MSDAHLTIAFEPDLGVLLSAFETNDDVGKIIRAHFVIERQIEQLITSQTRAKVDKRTSFYSKVNLLRAMGVPEKICLACEKINDLRNEFAHNAKATIANTRSISDKFLKAVEEFCPILPKSHGTFARKETGAEYNFQYTEATQAQRVVVAVSFMSAIIGALPKTHRFIGAVEVVRVAGFAP